MFKAKSKAPTKDSNDNFKGFLINDLPDSIIIASQDLSKCLFSNQSFSTLFNISSPSDIKSHLKEFSLHEDEKTKYKQEPSLKTLLDFVQYALNHADFSKGKKFSSIFTYTAHEPLVFEAKVFSKVWDNTPVVSIILHDMTEHYAKMELKINEVERLSTISHEFRTPLNGMLGLMEILMKKTSDPESFKYLDHCRDSGRVLLSLLDSSLDLNQIRKGKLKLCTSRFNLYEVLNDVVDRFRFACNNIKKISLNLDVSPSTPKYLNTDNSRLSQILIHLVMNAVKFTHKGGVTIAVKPSEDQRYIEITVQDTGVGLKDHQKELLRNILNGSLVGQQRIGLGLYYSERLARLLGGEEHKAGLSLESTEGEGSMFSLWIKTSMNEGMSEEIANEIEDVLQIEYDEENDKNYINEMMEQHTMVKHPTKF